MYPSTVDPSSVDDTASPFGKIQSSYRIPPLISSHTKKC